MVAVFNQFKSSIEEIIEEARNGRMFVLVDDEDRENEGDIVIPAQMATPEVINFMATYGRGLICLAMPPAQIARLDAAQISAVADGQTLVVDLDGEPFELAGDDLLVETQGAEGWAALREGGVTVALDTTVTPALRSKGLAREAINRIQNMRKAADFDVTDRIVVLWQGEGELAQALTTHGDWVARETLAIELRSDADPAGEHREQFELDAGLLTLAIGRS